MNELKDYLLGELAGEEKRRVEERLSADAAYRLEFERLQLTQTALLAVPEPEMPRRIAFVSDPVFETPALGFWQRLFAPAWAYACTALLAGSILAHGWLARPVSAGLDEVALNARIEKAVATVRADSEKRHAQMVQAMEETLTYWQKRSLRVERAGYESGGLSESHPTEARQ